MLSFKGRTAIVTGSAGALGSAYALDLAKRGCNLLLNDLPSTTSKLGDHYRNSVSLCIEYTLV